MNDTRNIVIDEKNEKQQVINYLTDLMATIQNYYFKSRMEGHPLWVHERFDNSAAISIDLYHFEGDGKPVCDGLNPCTITCDDGSQMKGNLYCISYDPDDVTPLTFVFDEETLGDMDVDPEDVPEDVLKGITEWLEKSFQAVPQKTNDVTSFFFYMWNAWCKEECRQAFAGGDWNHFWNKWCGFCDKYGHFGAVEEFYAELSNYNRDKLVERACKMYDGQCKLNK